MKRIALHWQIVIGLILGLGFGFVAVQNGWATFSEDWIYPFGTIFINLLKLIAIPLIIASLIVGMANLRDFKRLSSMGLKTIGIYVVTTMLAITVGIVAVHITKPGDVVTQELKEKLIAKYSASAEEKQKVAEETKEKGPLQPLIDIVPENIFKATQDNKQMLQVVFFAIVFGIGIIAIPDEKGKVVLQFFEGVNEVILKFVDFIMIMAPFGVFALMVKLVVDSSGDMDLILAVGIYGSTVIGGLAIMLFLFYPIIIKYLTSTPIPKFFKSMAPAQLLAFSTSSSAATLPVTMDTCERKLGIREDITSFVLPVGATVNMNGTSLYQAVAAIFIAQIYNIDLTLGDQLTIILTATLAAIGSAAVPGAGMVMLVVVLQSVGIPVEGLVFIVAPDRILDMARTVLNVTGDAMTACIVQHTEKKKPVGAVRSEQEIAVEA